MSRRRGKAGGQPLDPTQLTQSLYRQLTTAASMAFTLRSQAGEREPEVAEALRAIEKARRIAMDLALDTVRAQERPAG